MKKFDGINLNKKDFQEFEITFSTSFSTEQMLKISTTNVEQNAIN